MRPCRAAPGTSAIDEGAVQLFDFLRLQLLRSRANAEAAGAAARTAAPTVLLAEGAGTGALGGGARLRGGRYSWTSFSSRSCSSARACRQGGRGVTGGPASLACPARARIPGIRLRGMTRAQNSESSASSLAGSLMKLVTLKLARNSSV